MADPDGRAFAPGERCEDKMARRARIRARRAKEMEVAARAEAQFTETTVTVTTAYKQETRVRGATAAETNLGTPENFKQPEGASAAPKEREQPQKTSRLKEKKGGRRNVKRHIREKRRSTGIVNLQLSLADDLDDEHDQNPKSQEAVTTTATHQNDRKY
ncbi:Hypp8815 [Branchiostoma lanceolatum]|uniref:Hypp8815 protein n=1 Tax=Branchiostoma lanceolatum TaxID=7740 RepID=A0A8K0EG02_BRALA|nr:Hypp8815 [Branchiostoma lanceolatum]